VIPDNAHPRCDPGAEGSTIPEIPVVFVSKDINLRIKAAIAGIVSEDYENDRALDDFSLLYTGATERCRRTSGRSTATGPAQRGARRAAPVYEIARQRRGRAGTPTSTPYLPGEEEAN
jgi:PhoH-like ATPase